MKRYWLFGGDVYYPSGGWSDFIRDFDYIVECIEYYDKYKDNIARCGYGWFHVYDSIEKSIVKMKHKDYDYTKIYYP